MFARLLLLFTAVPLIELFLLVWIGRQVGTLATVLLVLCTGALGAWLAKTQGVRAFERVRAETSAGRLPAEAMVDGLLILIAGAVLLTPGLLTDLAGFALLTPTIRRTVRLAVERRLTRTLTRRGVPPGGSPTDPAGPRVIVIEPEEKS